MWRGSLKPELRLAVHNVTVQTHADNPESNKLEGGVSETLLQSAIERSGYPLQAVVVDSVTEALRGENDHFAVQEEWSYIDADTDQVRRLDAVISCRFGALESRAEYGQPSDPSDHLRVALDLLIECKQSDLPFVFFVRDGLGCRAPTVLGLPHPDLHLIMGDDLARVGMSATDCLGLYDLAFAEAPATAVGFARTHRKGKELELSGEDSFRGLALPLAKAFQHYREVTKQKPHHLFFDIRSVVPVAVLRAPMVAVSMVDGSPSMKAVPWIRVVQTDVALDDPFNGVRADAHFFDAVHVDYLPQYVTACAAAAREIGRRAKDFAIPIITGEARWSLPADSTEGGAGGTESGESEPAPYLSMSGAMSKENFLKWMAQRWTEVHSGDDAPTGGPSDAGLNS